MYWKQSIRVAVVLGAVAASTPLAAQTVAAPATSAVTAEPTWPAIVPRLTSYTAAQKASITDAVQQYCSQTQRPSRAELQSRIRAFLTPEQASAAVRYWIAQDTPGDLRSMQQDLRDLTADRASEQATITITMQVGTILNACGREQRPVA